MWIYNLYKKLFLWSDLMLSIENHFLDTNMILSIAFKDSNFNECREYYQLEYKRHISYNVKDETLGVIERMRLISSNVLKYIKDYMSSKNINLSDLDYHMQNIKRSYLNQFQDESYVFDLKKDKFVQIVEDLFIEYYDEIRNAMISDDIELESLSLKLRKVFKGYNESVSRCLHSFEKFYFDNDPDLIDQLISVGIHEKDAILVDDCYNKSKDISEKFVFVTQDNGIIRCSQDASELLDSRVLFSKPI